MNQNNHTAKRLNRRWLIGIIALLVVVGVVVCVLLLAGKDRQGDSSTPDISSSDETVDPYAKNKLSKGYYFIGDAVPELKENRITALVNEMYYTNGGHLCVNMTLGNGSNKAVALKSLNVKIINGYSDTVIAECYTEDITEGYTIAPHGAKTYRLYIDKSQVKSAHDLLDTPLFTITAVGTAV